MKKVKEFLWFLIPFLSLGIASVISFILTTEYSADDFILMLSNPFSIITIIFSFIPSVILSFVVVIIYKILLKHLFKKSIEDKKKYIYIFLISLIAPVLYIVIMTRAFNIIDNTIFSLQVGIIVTFVFWVIDLIKEKVNKKKQEQK